MITAWVLYAALMAFATCLARGHGLIPDPPSAYTQVDTTEPEEPDTALALERFRGR